MSLLSESLTMFQGRVVHEESIALKRNLRKRKHVEYSEIAAKLVTSDSDSDQIIVKRRKAQSNRQLPARKIFPFLSLPAEIRNRIYKLSVSIDDFGDRCLVGQWKHYRRGVRCYTKIEIANNWRLHQWSKGHDAHPEWGSDPFVARILKKQQGSEEDQSMDDDDDDPPTTWLSHALCPALLAVNHQIYEEAAPLLYSKAFYLEDTMALHAFLRVVGPSKRRFIEKIVIKGYGEGRGAHKAYNHPALCLLQKLPNLKEVRFDCNVLMRSWRPTDMKTLARQIYRDGFDWMEGVAVASGEYDKAVDLITLSRKNFASDLTENEEAEQLASFRKELRKLLAY